MYGGIASKIAMLAKKGSAVVAPDPALNFTDTLGNNDVDPCQDYTEEQVLGITEPITLTFTVLSTVSPPPYVAYRKASTPVSSTAYYCGSSNSWGGTPAPEGYTEYSSGWTALYNGSLVTSSITVSAGDYLAFVGSGTGSPFDPGSITIRINNETDDNAVIDTIVFEQQGCYLTTAVVQYKGLSDSGPELTAMRKLREHYRQVEGYDLLIQEYYENAPNIIEAIGEDPETYEEIYRSVKMCQAFVENENWQAAHDEYFRMYKDLKARYLK